MGFIRFILLFIIVYYVLSKYVFPFLLAHFIRKVQKNFDQFSQGKSSEPVRKEGETKVDYIPPAAKKTEFDPSSAEDVDFEEIKD